MNVLTISGRNINHVFPQAVELFRGYITEKVESRGGKSTLEHYGLVTTTYEKPCERVLFDPVRDCNPYFHFFESLWILAGRNDVAWLSQFLEGIKKYSDNGQTFHGAYGHRHDIISWNMIHTYRMINLHG